MTDKPSYIEPRKNLIIKQLPESFVQLQRELTKLQNLDIAIAARQQPTIGTALAAIATKLNILVDGDYDVEKLSAVLVEAMRRRADGKGSLLLASELKQIVDVNMKRMH